MAYGVTTTSPKSRPPFALIRTRKAAACWVLRATNQRNYEITAAINSNAAAAVHISGSEPMKVAVVTPYYGTREDWLVRCHESVREQTYPCTHLLVADGAASEVANDFECLHLELTRNIGDYGDTPRALGSIYAAGLKFDAVAYLDADNWFEPWHIQSLVDLHARTGAAVCTSGRTLFGTDGTCLGVDEEVDGERFVDTSCLFLTREAFDVFPVWSSMSAQLHAIDDRVVWAEIIDRALSRAHTGMPSAAYRTAFAFHYERMGFPIPDDAKTGSDVKESMRLVAEDEQRHRQRARDVRGAERSGRVWRYPVTLPRSDAQIASGLGILPGSDEFDREHLPDFICFGAQKSGTTWLYNNLRAHPEIFFPKPLAGEPAYFSKESHFFDVEERFARGVSFYAQRFAPGRVKVKGDMTPNYALLAPDRIATVRKLMPDVRLIFLMRNPIERAWSRVVMRVVIEAGRSMESMSDDELTAELIREDVRSNSDYLTIIRSWLRFFPGEQLWIGFMDDIVNRPEALLREVLAHINVSADLDLSDFPLSQRFFAGPGTSIGPNQLSFLRGMYAAQIEELYEAFGERVSAWRVSVHGH